jgi:hypothetical protein
MKTGVPTACKSGSTAVGPQITLIWCGSLAVGLVAHGKVRVNPSSLVLIRFSDETPLPVSFRGGVCCPVLV